MKRYALPVAGLLVLVLGGAYFWQHTGTSGTIPSYGTLLAAEAQDGTAIDRSLVEEMALGSEDAPLTVIEYASSTCPHCRTFHEETFRELKANYIDTGKVRFVFREVYFDRYGLWAGLLARCGGSERFFGIMDMIFARQAEWTSADSDVGVTENLARIGRAAGLTGEEIEACMQDRDLARAMVAVYKENAEEHGIRSTPSFIIDGDLVTGVMSYEDFSALIDARLDG